MSQQLGDGEIVVTNIETQIEEPLGDEEDWEDVEEEGQGQPQFD